MIPQTNPPKDRNSNDHLANTLETVLVFLLALTRKRSPSVLQPRGHQKR